MTPRTGRQTNDADQPATTAADEPVAAGADGGDRGSPTPGSADQRSGISYRTRATAARDVAAAPALWRREPDVAVVGSGAAGISVALTAAAHGLRVLVVTKDLVGGATPMAQGGLAAALGSSDTPAAHVADTLVAGAGLCSPDTVTALAESAPGAIGWLTGLGARLEPRDLRLEGGHSARRIVHSGDDATGAEVHRALLSALLASDIEIADRTVALDLLQEGADTRSGEVDGASPATASGSRVAGLFAGAIGADGRLTPGVITARAVVIAAGGLGQAFGTTSNPAGATGDGIAIAARAGAVIRDLEFVQFHPTVLWLPEASGQCPLITEALRGAGAVLRHLDGTPLMAGHDPRGDLAPRDVVAARMAEVIAAGDAGHVWLDATSLGRDLLENGFPTVTAACRKHGIDPVTAMIPVAPGAHYSCGGIRADLDGRTTIPGLYAVGEAASTGIQGANRLASNSVTEAIIAGRRTGQALAEAWGSQGQDALDGATRMAATKRTLRHSGPGNSGPAARTGASHGAEAHAGSSFWAWGAHRREEALANPSAHWAPASLGRGVVGRGELARAMSRYAGVMRDGDGLNELLQVIADAGSVPGGLELEAVETANLRTVSLLIAAGALRRAESRGCHRRRDATETAATPWHTLARWDGPELVVTEEEQ